MKKITFATLLTASFVFSAPASAQTSDWPPDDWMGHAEKDWYVDVEDWDKLNVRSLPNYKSKKVGALIPLTIVGIDEKHDNGWAFISSANLGGWVNTKYLCDFNSVPCKHIEKRNLKKPNLEHHTSRLEALPNHKSPYQQETPYSGSETKTLGALNEVFPESYFNFENIFSKLKSAYRDNDACFNSLKRRNELVGISMQLERNDPQAFRNVFNKFTECTAKLNERNVKDLTSQIEKMDLSPTEKTRLNNFANEYLLILEDSIGFIQIAQLMGISFE